MLCCLVLSCVVMSCFFLFGLVESLSCVFSCCVVLSCLVLSCFVSSCVVLCCSCSSSCLGLVCRVLSWVTIYLGMKSFSFSLKVDPIMDKTLHLPLEDPEG